MPTYEYRCPQGHEFERFYKTISGAPAEVACPECQTIAVRQLSGGAGLLFKGSGFYLTDYGKNAHRKPEGQKAEGQKAEGQKAEGKKAGEQKADSGKPESKSESAPRAESGASKSEGAKPKTDTSKKHKGE